MRKHYGDKPKRTTPKSQSAPQKRTLEQIAKDMGVHPKQSKKRK